MKRTSLILAAVGGAAVLAVTGTALGVSAAERSPSTTLAAATTAPVPGTPAPGAPATGTPSGAPATATPSGAPATGTPAPGTSTAPATDDPISEQRAGEIALAKAGGGQITEIEREQEQNRPVWSVEIINGDTEHEVEVDRENGNVVKAEQEKADDDDKSGKDDDDDDDDDDDSDDDDDDDGDDD